MSKIDDFYQMKKVQDEVRLSLVNKVGLFSGNIHFLNKVPCSRIFINYEEAISDVECYIPTN